MFEAHKKWSEVETEMNKYFPLHLIFRDYYDKASPAHLVREVNAAASGRMVCGKQYVICYIRLTHYGKKGERKIIWNHTIRTIYFTRR